MDLSLIVAIGVFIVALTLYRSTMPKTKTIYSEHPLYDEKEKHKLGESAKEKFDKGAYKDALRDVDSALELDPNSLYLLWLRASIHNALNNWHLALEDCERILVKNDSYHWAYEQRGMAYIYLKEFEKARFDFEQVLLLEKNSTRAYLSLFIIAMEEKKENQAHSYLKKILSLPFGKSDDLKGFLQFIYKMKAYSTVICFVDEALAKDLIPEESLLFYRAWSHYYLKNYAQALADADRMLTLNPENDVALRVKAYSYRATKDYEKAATAFQTFYDKKPDNLTIALEYGYSLWRLGRYEETMLIAKKLQLQNPDKSEYINLEGLVYLGINDFEKALEAFNKVIELTNDSSVYYDNRSISYRLLKQFDKAWDDAAKALSLASPNARLYCNRAFLCLADSKLEDALENVKKAIELDDNDAFVYATRSRVYVYWDNFEAALIDIQKARELALYRHWRFNVMEALIEANLGNYEQAQLLWKEAVTQDAKHQDESWVMMEYELPEKLLPIVQSLIKGNS